MFEPFMTWMMLITRDWRWETVTELVNSPEPTTSPNISLHSGCLNSSPTLLAPRLSYVGAQHGVSKFFFCFFHTVSFLNSTCFRKKSFHFLSFQASDEFRKKVSYSGFSLLMWAFPMTNKSLAAIQVWDSRDSVLAE